MPFFRKLFSRLRRKKPKKPELKPVQPKAKPLTVEQAVMRKGGKQVWEKARESFVRAQEAWGHTRAEALNLFYHQEGFTKLSKEQIRQMKEKARKRREKK